MKFSTRELVVIAVFGSLWGLIEMSLGGVLKSLHVPMSGVILSASGLILAMMGRLYVPRKGSTIFIGVIAALIKVFSFSGVLVGPLVGIITEAAVAELVLSLGGRPRRWLFVAAGALGVLWAFVQPFVTNPLLFGRSLILAWYDMLDAGAQLLGFSPDAVWLILLSLVVLHLLVGSLAGWLAWEAGRLLLKKMGRAPAQRD